MMVMLRQSFIRKMRWGIEEPPGRFFCTGGRKDGVRLGYQSFEVWQAKHPAGFLTPPLTTIVE